MFSEFQARSAFSFLQGASQPEELVHRAAQLGYRSLAVTDTGGFYGSARAHAAAQECGIRAVVGSSISLPDASRPLGNPPTLPVLCATHTGYQNLSAHFTNTHLDGSPPLLDLPRDQAQEMATGLLALTGDDSSTLVHHISRRNHKAAREHLEKIADIFGCDRTYVQLTRHHRRMDAAITKSLVELADTLGLPYLASNSPLHAARPDKLIADAFSCLHHKCTLDNAGDRLEGNHERHLKSPQLMRELFADLPLAVDNTLRLDDEIDFTLQNLGYKFPTFLGQGDAGFAEEHALLVELTHRGAVSRYGPVLPKKVAAQIKKELALIEQLRFSGYFLIVHDIMAYATSQGILCQGRGSAANSVVCFCLDITKVDPIACGLLFERFLSENRKSWPDIDIDFPSGDRREMVIQYVYEKYGRRGAAMTANVITYRPRSAFREMSKVLGFADDVAARFSQLCSTPRSDDPREDALNRQHEIAPMDVLYGQPIADVEGLFDKCGVPGSHPRRKALLHLYRNLQGVPRHLGQHSGGMVICDHGLDKVVPLQPASMPNRTVLQWDKDDCEDLGIIKIDLLGLGMLAAMQDAIEICDQRGRPVDLAQIPKDDPATFDLMCRADTVGTFQVESRAQMNTLPILRPEKFYDVAVEVAIIRPGPIVGELTHPFLNRRQGFEEVSYMHPLFEPILERTLGVPLFQEQVLQMAMVIADFSGTEADELRRAMSFRRTDERMRRITAKLREGMQRKGVEESVQEQVIHAIGSFALYGFPESHAISFALIAYASCYLKVHHPAEFYVGLLNNQPMGFYSPATLLRDARDRGIRARPVSVVDSEDICTVIDDHHIRLGLQRIKGLRADTIFLILDQRSVAAFTSLADFRQRCPMSARELRLLAQAGALNPLEPDLHRRGALWNVEKPLQLELFQRSTEARPKSTPPALKSMSPWQRMAADYATQSHTTGPHPMVLLRRQGLGDSPLLHDAKGLEKLPHQSPVEICGQVIVRQRPGTAKGHMFISLEDETGIANIFVPRDVFKTYHQTINTESFLRIHGHTQHGEGGSISVYTNHIEPLVSGVTLPTTSHDFH